MRQKGLRLPGNTHKNEGEMWADLPAFRQGHARGIYMNPSPQQYNVRYTEREGGKVVYCVSRRDSECEVEGSSGGQSPMTRGTRRGAKRKKQRV